MTSLARKLSSVAAIGCAFFVTACGSSSAPTEQSAVDNLRSVLTTYDSARPTDVGSTGSACAGALSGLQGSRLLASRPAPGKDLLIRQDLRMAYLQARQGFSGCAVGAKTMDYVLMARGDAELMNANTSLGLARTAAG